MRRFLLILAVLGLACTKDEPVKHPKVFEAFPELPVPPGGEPVSQSAGEDAMQLRFTSPVSPDTVALYYQTLFSKAPWRLMSDTRTADGGRVLLAQNKGTPLWVTIRKGDGASGSTVDLMGAKKQ
jgi:hypothetical protein